MKASLCIISFAFILYILFLSLPATLAFVPQDDDAGELPSSPFTLINDTSPDDDLFRPSNDSQIAFLVIHLSTTIPQGDDAYWWKYYLHELHTACNISSHRLIGSSDDNQHFVVYNPVPSLDHLSYLVKETVCTEAYDTIRDQLTQYGNVQFLNYSRVELPQRCLDECGTEGCHPCFLLHPCANDEECGPFGKCVASPRQDGKPWCISQSSASLSMLSQLCIAMVLVFSVWIL